MEKVHGSLLDQTDRIMELIYDTYIKSKITYERMPQNRFIRISPTSFILPASSKAGESALKRSAVPAAMMVSHSQNTPLILEIL